MVAVTQAGAAQAVTVSVGDTTYAVTTFTGSYDGNVSRFSIMEMPWWGNAALSTEFAEKVGALLGLPNSGGGPLFGWLPKLSYGVPVIFYVNRFPYVDNGAHPSDAVATYAVASALSPSTIPGPLPLFGVAAAFGASRYLRRRVKLSD
jgi:hypothetical protein